MAVPKPQTAAMFLFSVRPVRAALRFPAFCVEAALYDGERSALPFG
jgi:hypothetical protein